MCLCRNGSDSVAWHGDRIGRGAHTDTVGPGVGPCGDLADLGMTVVSALRRIKVRRDQRVPDEMGSRPAEWPDLRADEWGVFACG
jgi:hypothetical protein